MNQLGIIGIHTGVGKTIASAILCEALLADYWKPIQAGDLDESDSIVVGNLISNTTTKIHSEAYKLSRPLSPHTAAYLDGTEVCVETLCVPKTNNLIVIETAGGLLSPLNDRQTNLDLILHLKIPVILISQNYLGSINHTLLTSELLKNNLIDVRGILFSGANTPSTQEYILNRTGYKYLGLINRIELNKSQIRDEASRLTTIFQEAIQ